MKVKEMKALLEKARDDQRVLINVDLPDEFDFNWLEIKALYIDLDSHGILIMAGDVVAEG